MSFTSLLFLGFVLVSAMLTQFATGRARLALLLAASAVFAASYIATPLAVLPLMLFVTIGYGGIALAESGRTRHAIALTISGLVAAFVWLKHYPFMAVLPALPFAYSVVGLSYILFRILHLVLEVGDGALKRPHFARYMAYLFFFPSFLSGPVNRYQPFERDLDTPATIDREAAFATLWRLLAGFAKVAVIGECLHLAQAAAGDRLTSALAAGAPSTVIALAAVATAMYLVFLYANFSGYTDMAVAIARLFGIVLPENFNEPFMATNFQDFWSRWHMTLSEWFKFYFFNPLLKAMMRRWPEPRLAPYLGVAALFVVFVVLGAWHGASWGYVLSGVMMGTGVGTNKLYQVEMVRRFGKKSYRALCARPSYIWASRGLSLGWCALALTPFWLSLAQIGAFVGRVGLPGIIVWLAIMSAAFALGVLAIVSVLRLVRARLDTVERTPRTTPRAFALAAIIVVLAFAVPLLNATTEFVYKAF